MNYQEKLNLSLEEASIIIENYLTRYVDTYNIHIKNSPQGLYFYQKNIDGDETLSKYTSVTNYELCQILKVALQAQGYNITNMFLTNNDEPKIKCIYNISNIKKK